MLLRADSSLHDPGSARTAAAADAADAAHSAALAFADVSHGYAAGARPVVEGLSLSLSPGEVVCLLGPSGCGKTTTLRLAAGLERPWSGGIHIGGRRVADAARGRHVAPEHRRVGFLFQDFALFPHLTVLGNVLFGLKGRPRAEARARAMDMLAIVGLAGRADAWPHQMSGGQQQRVALARALAPDPTLMLLDEPFSGLDAGLRRTVRDQTLRVLQETGVAALMVTHDPEEAMFMADRIALMQAGRLVQVDAPMALHRRPRAPFAVRFFDETNEVAGTVRGGALETPLGVFAAPALPEGGRARLLARPESLILSAAPDAPEAAFAARVVSVRPLGAETVVLLSLEATGAEALPLIARVPGRAPDSTVPGAMLGGRLDPENCFVFADDGGGEAAVTS